MKSICGLAREPHSCVCRSHSLLVLRQRSGAGQALAMVGCRPVVWLCVCPRGPHWACERPSCSLWPRVLVAVARWGLARLCAWQGGRTVSGQVGLMGRRVRKVRSAEAGLSRWRAGQCFTGRLPRLLTWGEARCLG